jgi:hypothetical protein
MVCTAKYVCSSRRSFPGNSRACANASPIVTATKRIETISRSTNICWPSDTQILCDELDCPPGFSVPSSFASSRSSTRSGRNIAEPRIRRFLHWCSTATAMQGKIALSLRRFASRQDVSNGQLPGWLYTANLVEFGAVLLQRRIAAG